MKALVDTSSFVALARYYLPFDKSGRLSGLVSRGAAARNAAVCAGVLARRCGCS